MRDPDWDIVHRKTSQLTSRNFFIEDFSPGLLPASSVHDTKYKKPRPFIGAQNHTNVGITPETVTKFFPKSQITFPVPTLNSTGSHSTLGYALPRCPCSWRAVYTCKSAFPSDSAISTFRTVDGIVLRACLHFTAKWLDFPHFLHDFPNAGHSSEVKSCVFPQYLHSCFLSLSFQCATFPLFRLANPTLPSG